MSDLPQTEDQNGPVPTDPSAGAAVSLAQDQPSAATEGGAKGEQSPAQAPPASTVADEVERWWNDHFPGSVVGQNTAIWNYVQSAKEALKDRLRRLLA